MTYTSKPTESIYPDTHKGNFITSLIIAKLWIELNKSSDPKDLFKYALLYELFSNNCWLKFNKFKYIVISFIRQKIRCYDELLLHQTRKRGGNRRKEEISSHSSKCNSDVTGLQRQLLGVVSTIYKTFSFNLIWHKEV